MDAILEFVVPGPPVPQPRPKISTWGGRGRAYVEARHPIHAYRQAVELAARVAVAGARDYVREEGPVVLEVVCVFARPPSHLTKTGEPRATAKAYPPRCDWDNLGKGVADAITTSGVVWLDDDQVVDGRVVKRYGGPGDPPRTLVRVGRPDP